MFVLRYSVSKTIIGHRPSYFKGKSMAAVNISFQDDSLNAVDNVIIVISPVNHAIALEFGYWTHLHFVSQLRLS